MEESSTTSVDVLIERQERELSLLLSWIHAAESKLQLVLPVTTAMLGSLAILVTASSGWTLLGAVIAIVATIFLAVSIAFSALASFPKTNGPEGSLVYFGGIVSKDLSRYNAEVRSRSPDEYLEDLIQQCHRNAQIAERKYVWLQRSIAFMFVASAPWAAALFILYSKTS